MHLPNPEKELKAARRVAEEAIKSTELPEFQQAAIWCAFDSYARVLARYRMEQMQAAQQPEAT